MDSEQKTVNGPTGGDAGGQRPPMAANGGQRPTVTPSEAHTLSSKEVAGLFEQTGIPRSPRSAERYCEFGKLDCIKDPDEGHWYASKESVDLLIGQLKELQARHQNTEGVNAPETPGRDKGGVLSGAGGPSPSLSDRDREPGDAQRLKELEDKVWNLELDNKVKDQLLLRAKEEKQEDRKDLLTYSHRIGELETENQQLKLLAGGEQEKELKPEIAETEVVKEVPRETESAEKESGEPEPANQPGKAEAARAGHNKKSWWR